MNFEKKSVEQIKSELLEKLSTSFGSGLDEATDEQIYQALALMVRDEVMARRSASRGVRKQTGAKKVYYLSAEFLVGRALHNNMVNLVNEKNYLRALEELGIDKTVIFEQEPEPGLGNGGLGRLAACFLDSLTTLKLPAMGCSIRYEYGLFRQKIVDGYQVEVPDNWLEEGNVWEIPRPDQKVEVRFGGQVTPYDEGGRLKFKYDNYLAVEAVPYDIPYCALLPEGLENILTCGRCISVTHRAHASYRVMGVCLATGQAAGIAAALAAKENIAPRKLNVKQLQTALTKAGAVLWDRE